MYFLWQGCSGFASVFRTPDGTCNNLANPAWGSAFMPFLRFLPPDYRWVGWVVSPGCLKMAFVLLRLTGSILSVILYSHLGQVVLLVTLRIIHLLTFGSLPSSLNLNDLQFIILLLLATESVSLGDLAPMVLYPTHA